MDDRQPVLPCDLVGPADLLERVRVGRASSIGHVGADDHDLDPFNETHAKRCTDPDRVLRAPTSEGAQLEKRRVGIYQKLDALADE